MGYEEPRSTGHIKPAGKSGGFFPRHAKAIATCTPAEVIGRVKVAHMQVLE
jgi:hypothetical protein